MSSIANLRSALSRDISSEDIRRFAMNALTRAAACFVPDRVAIVSVTQEAIKTISVQADGTGQRLVWSLDRQAFGADEEHAALLKATVENSILLNVPESAILSFDTLVPALSGSNLTSLIENNFSVWSPFKVDEVYFLWHTTRSEAATTLHVDYVPKAYVGPIIEPVVQSGLRIDGLVLGDQASKTIQFDPKRQAIKWFRRNLDRVLGLGLILSIGLFMSAIVHRGTQTEAVLRAEVSSRVTELRRLDTSGNRALSALQALETPTGGGETSRLSSTLALLQITLPPKATILSLEMVGSGMSVTIPEDKTPLLSKAFEAIDGLQVTVTSGNTPGSREILITLRVSP